MLTFISPAWMMRVIGFDVPLQTLIAWATLPWAISFCINPMNWRLSMLARNR